MQEGSDTPDQGITRLQVDEGLAVGARLRRLPSGVDSTGHRDSGRQESGEKGVQTRRGTEEVPCGLFQ